MGRGFKNTKFYKKTHELISAKYKILQKKRMSSLALLPPRNFATRDAFSVQNRILMRKNVKSA